MTTIKINDFTEKILIEATNIVREYDRASASLLQRRLNLGYTEASKLMDILADRKVVAPSDGSSMPREVYKTNEQIKND